MASGDNGYDRNKLETLLKQIDSADAELLSLKGEYMQSCAAPRETMAAVFVQAKDAGIAPAAFRALVKNRRLDRLMNNNVDKLEADQRSEYEQMLTALGDFTDLPLGAAAVARVKPVDAPALDSLAP